MNLQIWLESDNIFSRSIEHCLRNRFADCGESWQAKCAASFLSCNFLVEASYETRVRAKETVHDVMV